MSIPINSDGMTKYIMEHINKGWTPAEQYISKFMVPVRTQLWEAIMANPGVFRPPKPPNPQLYDPDSCPVLSELPDGYALLANASLGGTLGIFGHPSGQYFKNALDFLPHYKWLGGMDVANTRCSCRLCRIIYQEDEFMRQTTNLAQSPQSHGFISPFSQLGLQISGPGFFSNNGAGGTTNGMQNNGPLSARSVGSLNGNSISPGDSGAPLELFPSHLANLSQIPLQQSFQNHMVMQSSGSQMMQGGFNNGTIQMQQHQQDHLQELQQNQPDKPRQELQQNQPEKSQQKQPESPLQKQPDKPRQEQQKHHQEEPEEQQEEQNPRATFPSQFSPVRARPPTSPSEYAPTPDHTIKAKKAPSAANSASKPPRKPRAKKAKNATTPIPVSDPAPDASATLAAPAPVPDIPAATADTPRAPKIGGLMPETPDLGYRPPNSGERPNSTARLDTISPKSTTAPSPASVPAFTEEAKMAHKLLQIQANNQALDKDVGMLSLLIKRYETKVDRLKFERRLLLGTLNTQKEALSGPKRNREDTSDSFVSDRDAESEVLHTEDLLYASDLQKISSFNAMAPKKKRSKKKRIKLLDPNAPKRPANAFIMFSDLQRTSINTERRILLKIDPESEELKSMGQLTKALGAKWRNLTEEERKEYQDMYHEQVQLYETGIKEYMAAHPNAPKEGSTEPLPDDWTDLNAPKRPANSFFVFCEMEDERLKKMEEEGVAAERSLEEEKEELERVSLALITRWRQLDQETRQDYIQEYESRLETYTTYMSKDKKDDASDKNNDGHRENSNHNTEDSVAGGDEEDELEEEEEDEEPEHAGLFQSSPRLDSQDPAAAEDSGDDAMDVEQEDFV